MSEKISDILLSVLLGMLGGISAYWYLADKQPEPVSIVTVDIRKIIDTEKEKLFHAENSNNAEENLKRFSNSLHEAIAKAGNGRIVIVKDAIISGTRDITDEVRNQIR